jgi:hypothetical protein
VTRRFVTEFLLPLVRGGTVLVGRPLSRRSVEALARAHVERPTLSERRSAKQLGQARQRALTMLVPSPPALPLDEVTWRLGAAVHDLLALGHPGVVEGPRADARIERIAAAATALAGLGAPTTLAEVLARHSVLARLPELVRSDTVVRYWLGRLTFVGRQPPPRVVAMPRLRGVRVETARRVWLRDIGVPAAARGAFLALTEASPLGEALDPLRLDPPLAWGRVLAVLRFPAICRAVAGRLLDIGLPRAGDALADALYRFAALQDPPGPVRASGETVAFAIGFLAHLVWLDHLFSPPAAAAAGEGESAGRELAVVLAAAERVRPALLWPPDVPAESDVGARFARHLRLLRERHDVEKSPRWPAALELAELAGAPATATIALPTGA